MPGQPQIPGFWEFNINGVDVVEVGGASPSIVINSGNSFNFTVTLSLTGFGAAAGGAPWYNPGPPVVDGAQIRHHAMRLEDGATLQLPYKIPTGAAALAPGLAIVTTGPFTTGPGNDLGVGTWRITTHVHLTTPGLAAVEAGFYESILMVL